MMMPPLVSIADLEGWIGTAFAVDDLARAEAVLDAVSAQVRSETGQTWVDDSDPPALVTVPQQVVTVTLQVARRVALNPDGFQSEKQADYSYSLPSPVLGAIAFRPEERAMLARYRPSQRGLWSQPTTRGDIYADTVYVPVDGAPPFPWYAGDVT